MDLSVAGLMLEQRVEFLDEAHKVCFPHAHLHLSLVNLAQVHHLVDESQNALGIAAHNLVDAPLLRVFFALDERQQWRDNECHRCADVVAEVHKETQLRLTQFLGMDMLLQLHLFAHPAPAVGDVAPYDESQKGGIEQVCPPRTVPRGMHYDRKRALGCLCAFVGCLDAEAVGARGQTREGNLVCALLQRHKRVAVDAVQIGDACRVVEGQRGEADSKRVVAVVQFEVLALADQRVRHLITARQRGLIDRYTIDGEGSQVDGGVPLTMVDVGRVEPRDAARAAEQQSSVCHGPRSARGEVVGLQTVLHIVVLEPAVLGVQT